MGTGPSLGLATTGGLAALGDVLHSSLVMEPKLTQAVGTVCSKDSAVVQRLRDRGLISKRLHCCCIAIRADDSPWQSQHDCFTQYVLRSSCEPRAVESDPR